MSEALLWLNYCLSAVIAFSAVYLRNWRVTSAMLLGTLATVAVWLIVSLVSDGGFDDAGFESALVTNGSLSLIFAGAGAAIAHVVLSQKREP